MQYPTIQTTRRSAFTLVELLTVIIILSILATIGMAMTAAAMESARVAKTRAPVLRVDTALLQIFESYEERYAEIVNQYPLLGMNENDRAKAHLHLIRDLMRMEMPMTRNEATTGPLEGTIDGQDIQLGDPAVRQYYAEAYDQTSSPDMLYLIIANLNPEALEFFSPTEIADTNGDGFPEFIDAWGQPIRFLRWAPALMQSTIQTDVVTMAGIGPETGGTTGSWGNGPSDWNGGERGKAWQAAQEQNPDPFDKFLEQHAWFLYPLVYSAGPDGIAGYEIGNNNALKVGSGSAEGILDPYEFPYGYPLKDDNGELHHYDNITNHQR